MNQDTLNLINDEEAFSVPTAHPEPRYRLTLFVGVLIGLGLFMNWIGGF